jgi:NAD(P)-dependent dehydrogenase (short-subunit alcohol dehydrogenase family)
VNLLINNAGIMLASPMLAEGSEAALRAEMEVNVFGMLRMVRAFAPVLARNGGGAIANMLSVVSWKQSGRTRECISRSSNSGRSGAIGRLATDKYACVEE